MKCLTAILVLLTLSISLSAQTPAISPTDALKNYHAGRSLEAQGRPAEAELYYAEAVRICNEEIARNPNNSDSYAVLTWTLQRQKKYSEVISWGERALRVNNSDYRVVEIMGEAYFYLDNYNTSLSYMQRYVSSVPRADRVSVAYFFIGEIFRLQGKLNRADIAYTTAVRLEPSLALWWYRLGQVREQLGDRVPAAAAYQQALKLNPAYKEADSGLKRVSG